MCRAAAGPEPQFPSPGRVQRLWQPQDTLDPQPGNLPPPQAPTFRPSSLHGLPSACPLLLLAFWGHEGTAVGTESGRPREGCVEGLRGPCSRLATAPVGPLGAECSCRNWVTQMPPPPPSVCQGRSFLVPRHRLESAFTPLGRPQTSISTPGIP